MDTSKEYDFKLELACDLSGTRIIDLFKNYSNSSVKYVYADLFKNLEEMFGKDNVFVWGNIEVLREYRKITKEIEEKVNIKKCVDYDTYVIAYLLSKRKKIWSIINSIFEAEYGNCIQYLNDKLLDRKNLVLLMSPEQFSQYQKCVCIIKNNMEGRKRLISLFISDHKELSNYLLRNAPFIQNKEYLEHKVEDPMDVIKDPSWLLLTYENVLMQKRSIRTSVYETIFEQYVAGMLILEKNGYKVECSKKKIIEYLMFSRYIYDRKIKKDISKKIFMKIVSYSMANKDEKELFINIISLFRDAVSVSESIPYEQDVYRRLSEMSKEELLILLGNYTYSCEMFSLYLKSEKDILNTIYEYMDNAFKYMLQETSKEKLTKTQIAKAKLFCKFLHEFVEYAMAYFTTQDLSKSVISIVKKPKKIEVAKEIVITREIHLEDKEKDKYEKVQKASIKEIADLKKQVQMLKEQLKEAEAGNKELYAFREMIHDYEDTKENSDLTEDIEEYARLLNEDIRGVVVGGHSKVQNFMQNRLPDWKMIPSNYENVNPDVIRCADVVAIFTCHIGHPLYKKVVNIIKNNTKNDTKIVLLNSNNIDKAIKIIFEKVTL